MSNNWTLEVKSNRIAHLVLNVLGQSTNYLSSGILSELQQILGSIRNHPEIGGLIVSSNKPGSFVSNYFMQDLQEATDQAELLVWIKKQQLVLAELANLNIPKIAVINGNCINAGIELLSAFDYRLAAEDAEIKFAFTYRYYGLIPILGSISALCRWLGLSKVWQLYAEQTLLNIQAALKEGLIEEISPADKIIIRAEELLLQLINNHTPLPRARAKPAFVDNNYLGRRLSLHHFIKIINKRENIAQPQLACWLRAARGSLFAVSLEQGRDAESHALMELLMSDNFRNIFRLAVREQAILASVDSPELLIKALSQQKAAILGANTAGVELAIDLAWRNMQVYLLGQNEEECKQAESFLAAHMPADDREASGVRALVTIGTDWQGLEGADYLWEALGAEWNTVRVLANKAEAIVSPYIPLIITTPWISPTELSGAVRFGERVVGYYRIPAVDQIVWAQLQFTAVIYPELKNKIPQLAVALGDFPFIAKDLPGGLVYRLLVPYISEALRILEEQECTVEEIDKVMKEFGVECAPFELISRIGVKVLYPLMVALNRTNIKRYPIRQLIFELSKDPEAKIPHLVHKIRDRLDIRAKPINREDILQRLLYSLQSEATLAKGEKGCTEPLDLDLITSRIIGFPSYGMGISATDLHG